MKIILTILLTISIMINVALYKGWISTEKYQELVDKGIESGKEIVNSEEMQSLVNKVKTEFQQTYGEDYNTMKDNVKDYIKDYSKEKAKEYLTEKYGGLGSGDIEIILEDASEELLEEMISEEKQKESEAMTGTN